MAHPLWINVEPSGIVDAGARLVGVDEQGRIWRSFRGGTSPGDERFRALYGFGCPRYADPHPVMWQAESSGARTCEHRTMVLGIPPAADPLRLGWADPFLGHVARQVLGKTTTHTVDPFDTHQALLDADALTPYDVVVLRASDPLNAMAVRDAVRSRGHVRAVALCTGCRCAGGPERAHGVDPATFDASFLKSTLDWRLLCLWLDDLAEHPSLFPSTDSAST